MPDARLPLTPSTVLIMGTSWSPRSTIWAGLRLHRATLGADGELRVPWCHINDRWAAGGCVYTLQPRQDGYRFARARNGAWVLEPADA